MKNKNIFLLTQKGDYVMIEFKSQDLVFLSKLDLKLDIKAIEKDDEGKKKPYWILSITAENNEYKKIGALYGARGEIRKFYQLNSLVEFCKKYIDNCEEVKIIFN